MDTFGGNGAEGQRNSHLFSTIDRGETSATAIKRDMGDVGYRSSAGSGVNAVGDYLPRKTLEEILW